MLPTHQLSDAELIQAFLEGREQGIEILIRRYKDKIYTAIFMLVKDRFVAEDLFQEAFLKMIRTMRDGRYCEQGKFLPWAIRVAHNLCMDHFRKVRQQYPITLPDGRDIGELLDMHTEHAAHAMEQRQTHDGVRSLIDRLPEEQKEVVVLRMYGDLSFKDIAAITGVSINTALGRMRYALINLRKMITEKQLVLR